MYIYMYKYNMLVVFSLISISLNLFFQFLKFKIIMLWWPSVPDYPPESQNISRENNYYSSVNYTCTRLYCGTWNIVLIQVNWSSTMNYIQRLVFQLVSSFLILLLIPWTTSDFTAELSFISYNYFSLDSFSLLYSTALVSFKS